MSAALTDLEKAKVAFFLGYSVFEDDGPEVRSLNSLAARPLAGDFIRPILDKLERIDVDIFSIRPIAKAIKDGAIELRANYTFSVLCRMGRQLVGRLSTYTKISIASDVFSRGSGVTPETFYSGDPSEHRIDASRGVPTLRSGG